MTTAPRNGRDYDDGYGVHVLRAIKNRSETPSTGLVGVPAATRRDFRRRQFLVEAGWPADATYLIRSGYVRTYLLDGDGRETITAILGPGHLVGLGPLLGRATYGRFADALTDVETWRVPMASPGERMFAERGLLGLALGSLAQRLAFGLGLLRAITVLPMAERVVDVENRLAGCLRGIAPPLKRNTLAALIHVRPETLARNASKEQRSLGSSAVRPLRPAVIEANEQAFGPGELVLCDDLPAGMLGVLEEGRLQLSLVGPQGRAILIDTLEANDPLSVGSLLCFPPVGLRATSESAGRLRIICADQLLRWLVDEPAVVRRLLVRLGRRLERLERQLACVGAGDVRHQLAELLQTLAAEREDTPSGDAVVLPRVWSHEALASQIGVRRETVTRALAELIEAGTIRRQGHHIVVLQQSTSSGRLARDADQVSCECVKPSRPTCESEDDRMRATASPASGSAELSAGGKGLLGAGGSRPGPPPPGASYRLCGSGAERTNIAWLAISSIDEPHSSQNSRTVYREVAIDELAASIRKHGLLQPLCVRPDGSRYRLVFGVRRLRAARRAGLLEVPCTVRIARDDRAFVLNALENLHRRQLTPNERAQLIERLASTGLGVREIGRRLGFNASTISRSLRINRSPELKAAVEDGALDIGRAVILLDAPRSALPDLIVRASSVSAPELRAQIATLKSVSPPEHASTRDPERLREALRCLRAVGCTEDLELLEALRREIVRLTDVASCAGSRAPSGAMMQALA